MAIHTMQPSASQRTRAPAREGLHGLAWILGILGLAVAALGAWMLIAPSDGTVTILIPLIVDGMWPVAELVGTWATPLLVIGGLVATVAFGVFGFLGLRGALRVMPAVELLLGVVGAAAALAGVANSL